MMTLEQYQEREGLLDRIDDLESKLSALQSERDDLKMQLGIAIITYDDLLEVSLKETGRLQSERDQLKKVIDQCEEALNGADRFIGKVGCGDDCLPKCIETALDAIQSLKLKGK